MAIIDPRTIEQVLGVAFAIKIITGHAHPKGIAHWQVNHTFDLEAVIIAVFNFAGCAKARQIRPRGAEVDHARSGVAAEQRALRPTQHLDAVDIEKGEIIAVLPRHVDVIDIGADRWIKGRNRLGIAKPADIIGIRRPKPGVVRPEQVRHILD